MAAQPVSAGNQRVKRFGVLVDDFSHFAGSGDFIVSLVDGVVRTRGSRDVVLIVRGPREQWIKGFRNLLSGGLPNLQTFHIPRHDWALEALCRKAQIDVVGPSYSPPGPALRTPWIGYIYDFQHVHLPHYFTADAIAERNREFGSLLGHAKVVVVHSRSVKEDALAFLPSTGAEIVPLSLSAMPRPEWLSADAAAAQAKYGIGDDYFLVSNQFWVHKHHEVAIEAFARIASAHPQTRLVLTGSTEDWRAPTRLQDIEDLIARLVLANRVHILGFIPKLDQIAIMRGARAVLQPTAFEGAAGGHAVYDAIALGVPSILSDIPVNREIENQVAAFFPLDDAAALAARMEEAYNAPREDKPAETLLREGEERRKRFGEEVWRAAQLAAEAFAPASR